MRRAFLLLSLLLGINCTFFAQNNVGIGTTTPHSSARLDITATDKGILVPRVSLFATNNASPIVSPAIGLLVWNTNFGFPNGIGFNYWDGSNWQTLLTDQKGWRLTGNSGTNPTNNFIGTTDDVEFSIRVNNIRSGFIDHHNKNLFLGYHSGENITTGGQNTFLGDNAGSTNTTASQNTCVGASAGASVDGSAFGNCFFGTSAGVATEDGSHNTFLGYLAGFFNESGVGNTFVGMHAGAGFNLNGSDNSYLGRNSGASADGGNRNSFFGANSGGTGGSNNSGLGDSSGYTVAVGSSENTFLGFKALNLGSSFNATAVGARARINCSNCVILGSVDGINGATSSVNVGIGLTNPVRPLHISGSATTTGITPNSDAVMVVEKDGGNAYISMLTDNDRSSGINFGNQFNNLDGGIYYNLGGTGFDLRFRTNGNVTRMLIDSIGRVGIGTTTPDFQLELNQNSAAKPTSPNWTVPSDLRLKENVFAFTDGLSILQQINPVWFTYNGEAGLPKETGVGTIAQELKLIAPYMIKEWTRKDDKGYGQQYLGVDYGPMQFILINSIKEQQSVIENLQKEIADFKTLTNDLIKRIEALEKRN